MKSVFPGQYDDDNSLEQASESDPEREEITKVVRAIEAAIAAASPPKPAQKVEPLTETEIMDQTRELSRDFRWPSTMIDVWRLCEAAHGITGENK